MPRVFAGFSLLSFTMLTMAGCSSNGNNSIHISAIYGVTAVLSLLLLIGYCLIALKKDPWFLLLFASIVVVNIGYFALSISKSLDEALLANRLAYLGSVFLPLSMWMIILNVTRIQYHKWLPSLMLGIGFVVFLIAASPGYLDIYYKEVSFQITDGVAVLKKVYGPLHVIYLFYLLGYFAAMVITIIRAVLKDKLESKAYAIILALAVFVNIGVWLIEQLVHIDFEMLSISYIISECFLLGLHIFLAEIEKKQAAFLQPAPETVSPPAASPESPVAEPILEPIIHSVDPAQIAAFTVGLSHLTPTERIICECYIEGKTTKQIMAQLNIKENTLKFHNKNIYSKVGVSSRKQLVEFYNIIYPDKWD